VSAGLSWQSMMNPARRLRWGMVLSSLENGDLYRTVAIDAM
jgi:hypothetical protein